MQLSVLLCRAASALCPSGMMYILLFYVVWPNISDYAYMLIHPSGMMSFIKLIFIHLLPSLLSEVMLKLPVGFITEVANVL
jgi:hypothetical protein